MARLQTRKESSLSPETKTLLEPTRVNGKILDVYLQFANSEQALHAYMKMEESLRNCALTTLEIETIKLLVSEITLCDFCRSTHSMKSRKAGLSKDQQISVRAGRDTEDPRLNAIADIVRHFFNKPGPLNEALITRAREQKLSDEQLVDIAMAVSTIFFTNITNQINNTEPTLPAAPAL